MELYEAHLLLRALRRGDKQGYASLVLQSWNWGNNHRYAAPYDHRLCTNCGLIQQDLCPCPVQNGCFSCMKSGYIHPSLEGAQAYWVFHANMLHYFSNCSLEENAILNQALSTMWELQEHVVL
jgi:hypothetical protein